MEIKFLRNAFVDPSLSAEEQGKIKRMMLKCSAGSEQNFLGETRRELAEEFLNFIEAGRRKKLEEEISSLHIIKDEGRFRIQLLLMLFEAFFSGATYGRDDLRLKEAPEQK